LKTLELYYYLKKKKKKLRKNYQHHTLHYDLKVKCGINKPVGQYI